MAVILVLIGLYGCFNGLTIEMQATSAAQQTVAYLSVGFGLVLIGLGALVSAIGSGFAKLERLMKEPPVAAQMADASPRARPSNPTWRARLGWSENPSAVDDRTR